ncbi:MAG: radical SAM family heme chaperone HemW [Propionibacteriaceae bacterium]|jgi:oxygen-independent coproporphyrinogen-3 oxidase|nr:radical SAM family heme chaperone HemW [Propionibacteriaceae bacterium]
MAGQPPVGDPAPPNGALPRSALAGRSRTPFGIYLHVPYCAARCGYCDFNTYTSAELGAAPGASQSDYLLALRKELDLALRVLGTPPKVSTIYFGGGTPTLLPAGEQAAVVDAIRQRFPVAKNAEITTEANPESVSEMGLDVLALAGFNRISLGMQSAVPHVLEVLERRHSLGRVEQAVGWARAAGFKSVGLDLIYGTPGETLDDWRVSLETALALRPDHVSAYSLTLEPGTRLAARVARGELLGVDEDFQADCYLLADSLLNAAGLPGYEISNWAKRRHECRHNLGYWRSSNWWGIGPGAHSHIGGVRWWNVRHPRDYTALVFDGKSPAQGREVLDGKQLRTERVMLGLRLAAGLDASGLALDEHRLSRCERHGLIVREGERLRLTPAGRLFADAIIRDLLD